MGENEYSLFLTLRVKTLALLDERHHTAKGENDRQKHQGNNEAKGYIADDESDNTATGSSSRPIDVAALETQKFKRPLKPLEHWIIGIENGILFHASHVQDYSPPMPKNRGRA